jgi:hypothetical protein
MDLELLSLLAETPEAHRKVLSGYQGAYSLGVGQSEDQGQQPVLILQVEGSPSISFPDKVYLGGETVPVVVRSNFLPPRSL